MSSTDTNQASELFELCKKVYELTGWKYTIGRFHDDGSYDGYVRHRGIAYTPNPQNAEWLPKDIPLYTSDYLLQKLPNGQRVVKVDEAYYVANNVQGLTDVNADGKSALAALLKFTLFLNKEGLL